VRAWSAPELGVLLGAVAEDPVDWRLVLPRRWAEDPRRRKRAGVPAELGAEEPWDCAVELVLQWARRAGGIQRPVLLDLRGGQPGAALDRLVERDVPFVAQVSRTTPLRPAAGLAPAAGSDRGDLRVAADLVRTAVRRPIGSPRPAGSPLAVLPVGPLAEDRRPAPAERPLLLLADSDGNVPSYYLTNLARSSIDRSLLQPLQQGRLAENQLQELGLADFEGRSFRGWHHQ
jgi:hypothetical protein